MEAARHPWPALGALLVRDGALEPEQLETALAMKQQNGQRLGEILLAQGLVSPATLARVLAEQHELPYVDLQRRAVEPDAALLLPEAVARRTRAVPVAFEQDGRLLVAVADPTDVFSSDDLRLALGVPIRVAVSPENEIAAVLDRLWAGDGDGAEIETEDRRATVVDLHAAAVTAPAIRDVNTLIVRAIELGASDLHFTPQRRRLVVRARVDGVMRELGWLPTSRQAAVVSRLKVMAELDIAERRAPQDGRVALRIGGRSLDLRVAVLPTTHGEKVTLRILGQGERSPSIAALGMAPEAEATFLRALHQPFGAVIVCGPTGAGKTTTLYAAAADLNDQERCLTTIEDPVEIQLEGADQIEVNPRAGLTFASGLRTILRSDPDVLLVGEIRDEETARIAFQAAMTGHLLLTSLHSHSAVGALSRLADMGVDPGLLATSINCIVGQRLARRLCDRCRVASFPDAADAAEVGIAPGGTVYVPRGCDDCDQTGYRGRVGMFEVLAVQGDVRRLVHGSTEEAFAAAVAAGMQTLRQDGMRLVRAGLTSLAEVRRVTGERLA